MPRLIPLALAIALAAGSAAAQSAVEDAAPGATPWQPWGGTWLRLEADGNLSCFSFNGKDCEWRNAVTNPAAHPPEQVRPLVCGVQHQLQWGFNGYNDDADYGHGTEHWCRSAYALRFAKWRDYSVLGFDMMLSETPAGDAMCFSDDGRRCSTIREINEGSTKPLTPLVCGAHHRRMHGYTGYDRPGHWCRTPLITRHERNVPTGREVKGEKVWDIDSWTSNDQPSIIVRADLTGDRTMGLLPVVRALDSVGQAYEERVGFSAGTRQWTYIGDSKRPAPWSGAASRGLTTMAVSATANGKLCYFASLADMPPAGSFFDRAPIKGNSTQVLPTHGLPDDIRVTGSPKFRPSTLLLQTQGTDQDELLIKDFILAVARRIPVEGSLTGERRPLPYTQGCDGF